MLRFPKTCNLLPLNTFLRTKNTNASMSLSAGARFFSKTLIDKTASTIPIIPSVDFNPLGRCQLNCAWCWGPEHNAKEPIRLEQWKETFKMMKKTYGTSSIIITGGEPLLKGWLPEFVEFGLGLKITTFAAIYTGKSFILSSYDSRASDNDNFE
jgi:hypothetical protein